MRGKRISTSAVTSSASNRLRYDPVLRRCHYLTGYGHWMKIDEVNKYCLLHILRGLEAEGKQDGMLYQFVATEAARRGVLDELPKERTA